jgi:hypothetical protein
MAGHFRHDGARAHEQFRLHLTPQLIEDIVLLAVAVTAAARIRVAITRTHFALTVPFFIVLAVLAFLRTGDK